MAQLCEKKLIPASCHSRESLTNSTRWRRRTGEKSLRYAENMRFLESIIVKILEEHGLQVAIPSISRPGGTTCVVMSRERDRAFCEWNSQSQRRSQIQSPATTWAVASTEESRAAFLTLVPNKASLYTRKIIPKNEKKWMTIHAHPRRGSDLAVSISKNSHDRVASFRSRRTRVWWFETLGVNKIRIGDEKVRTWRI